MEIPKLKIKTIKSAYDNSLFKRQMNQISQMPSNDKKYQLTDKDSVLSSLAKLSASNVGDSRPKDQTEYTVDPEAK